MFPLLFLIYCEATRNINRVIKYHGQTFMNMNMGLPHFCYMYMVRPNKTVMKQFVKLRHNQVGIIDANDNDTHIPKKDIMLKWAMILERNKD